MTFDNIQAFLDLVKNPSKYETVLNELVKREQNWKELVEAHTKLAEVDHYVKRTKDAADRTLSEAEIKANGIILEAEKVNALGREFLTEAEKDKADNKALQADLKAKEKELKAKEKELVETISTAKVELESSQASRKYAEELISQYTDKLNKFKELAV